MNNTNLLQKSLLETLAYYRVLKTPLTLVQVARYAVSNQRPVPSLKLSEIKDVLDSLVEKGMVIKEKGLYWLKRAGTRRWRVSNRTLSCSYREHIQREKIAQKKLKIVRNAAKIMKHIPGLRGIFVCGSVARKVSRKGSDIDLLILTRKNRVWTVRFFLTVLAFLLGKKTKDTVSRIMSRRNKFCLNHFRSDNKLTLEKNLQDLYSAQEYARMTNAYSDGRIENKFFSANKKWMGKFLPEFDFAKPPIYTNRVETHRNASLKRKIDDLLEKFLQKIQIAKILKSSQNFSRLDNRRIVFDNGVIIFHLNPRAPAVLGKYKELLDQ